MLALESALGEMWKAEQPSLFITRNAVKIVLTRLRMRFQELLRQQVGRLVGGPAALAKAAK